MPIRTRVARLFVWKYPIVALVCVLLGLWGIYDYVYAIPARERAVERGHVASLALAALEPDGWAEHAPKARDAVQSEITRLFERGEGGADELGADPAFDQPDEADLEPMKAKFEAALEEIRERDEEGWLAILALFNTALLIGEPPGYPLEGVHLMAHETAEQVVQAVADVARPRQYDRTLQWAFILCIPFAPYLLGVLYLMSRRIYQMDEDGTLHLPGREPWLAARIADIDMSRWMRKSIATVVHADGTRVKLDAYKYAEMDRIVGAIAARLYPDQWGEDARPKGKEKDADTDTAPVEAAETGG